MTNGSPRQVAGPYDREERANTISHGIGCLLSLVGVFFLLRTAVLEGEKWRILGAAIYGFSLIGVYAMSTLSHAVATPERKHRFRILDQAFIYFLIVGTYTPFSLAYLRTPGWWVFLSFLWVVAIGGFLSKLLLAHRVDAVSVWLYLLLGWLPCFAWRPLSLLVPHTALYWMLIGGLCYTLGVVFLLLDHKFQHFHVLWHLFVIAGSACHFFVILLFVARTA